MRPSVRYFLLGRLTDGLNLYREEQGLSCERVLGGYIHIAADDLGDPNGEGLALWRLGNELRAYRYVRFFGKGGTHELLGLHTALWPIPIFGGNLDIEFGAYALADKSFLQTRDNIMAAVKVEHRIIA